VAGIIQNAGQGVAMARIFIVDEDPTSRLVLTETLSACGHEVVESAEIKKAVAGACSQLYDLIILSLDFPKEAGIRAVRTIVEECQDIAIVVLTSAESVDAGIEALHLGAHEILVRPINPKKAKHLVARAIMKKIEADRSRRSLDQLKAEHGFGSLVCMGSATKKVLNEAKKAAKVDKPVLLLGEVGTGKESFARAIHFESSRARGPFLKISCAGTAADEVEKQLFGYEERGMVKRSVWREGLIEQADGGSVFIDDIDFASMPVQQRLLKFLTDGMIERSGGKCASNLDVRVFSASSADLSQAVAEGRFNKELFNKLSAITISLPALRERKEDIPELVRHFVEICSSRMGRAVDSISEAALSRILEHQWNGNIMEMRNAVEYAVMSCDGNCIQPSNLPLDGKVAPESAHRKMDWLKSLREIECSHIERVLAECGWNRSLAAQVLEIDRKTLRGKIREFGLEPPCPDGAKQDP